jgi:glutaredoxin
MNGNLIFVYSMEGCPWCKLLKEKLTESNIDFIDRPIEKYDYEYAKFKTVTKNDLVPAMVMMRLPQVLKEDSKAEKLVYLCPDTDFKDLDEALTKVIEFVNYHEHDLIIDKGSNNDQVVD